MNMRISRFNLRFYNPEIEDTLTDYISNELRCATNAAKILKVNVRTVTNLIRAGEIKGRRSVVPKGSGTSTCKRLSTRRGESDFPSPFFHRSGESTKEDPQLGETGR